MKTVKMISIKLTQEEEDRCKELGVGYKEIFRRGLTEEDIKVVREGRYRFLISRNFLS